MYLNDGEEAEVLLRLIDDCDRLVEAKSITAGAAFCIVSEAARHHDEHPAKKRERSAEIEAKAARQVEPLIAAAVDQSPEAAVEAQATLKEMPF